MTVSFKGASWCKAISLWRAFTKCKIMWLPYSLVPFPLQNHFSQLLAEHLTTVSGSWIPQYAHAWGGRLLKSYGSTASRSVLLASESEITLSQSSTSPSPTILSPPLMSISMLSLSLTGIRNLKKVVRMKVILNTYWSHLQGHLTRSHPLMHYSSHSQSQFFCGLRRHHS